MNWTITLTDEQIRVAKNALEEYFRVRLGQYNDLTDSIAFADCDSGDKLKWQECFARREAAQVLMESAYRLMRPIPHNKTEDMMIAQVAWDAIRHALWMSQPKEDRERFGGYILDKTPLQTSQQPLPKIKQEVIRSAK